MGSFGAVVFENFLGERRCLRLLGGEVFTFFLRTECLQQPILMIHCPHLAVAEPPLNFLHIPRFVSVKGLIDLVVSLEASQVEVSYFILFNKLRVVATQYPQLIVRVFKDTITFSLLISRPFTTTSLLSICDFARSRLAQLRESIHRLPIVHLYRPTLLLHSIFIFNELLKN